MKSKFPFNHLAMLSLLLLCITNLFAQTILNFRSYIDGSDYVHIQGQNVWYEHRNWQLPGKWNGANEPTYINGDPWFPDWSSYPLSNKYNNLTPPLPSSGNVNVTLEIIAARGNVTLTQAPNSSNGYEAIILFDDDPPGGPDWYEINLKLESSCVPPKIKIEYLDSLNICQTHSVLLSANGNSGKGYTYQWMKDNTAIPGAESRRYTATAAGSYTVLVKNNLGCSTLSNPVIITSCPVPPPCDPSAPSNCAIPVNLQVGDIRGSHGDALSWDPPVIGNDTLIELLIFTDKKILHDIIFKDAFITQQYHALPFGAPAPIFPHHYYENGLYHWQIRFSCTDGSWTPYVCGPDFTIPYSGQHRNSLPATTQNAKLKISGDNNIIKISPNPFPSTLKIEFRDINSSQKFINLFDVNGKLVSSHRTTQNLTEINVKGLAKGAYFIRIDGAGKLLYSGKVMKE